MPEPTVRPVWFLALGFAHVLIALFRKMMESSQNLPREEMNMRMLIWLTMIGGAAATACGRAGEVSAQGKAANVEVRALKLAPPRPPMTIYTFAGRNEMISFANAEAIEKLMGKDTARGLVDAVDFSKEKIVLVSWTTSGPPDGVLRYQEKNGTIEFFVQGPGGVLRGERLRLGADFFAVPRDAEVVFDRKER